MSSALLWIVSLFTLFLRKVQEHDDCPDGLCDEPLNAAAGLASQLKQPTVSLGVFDWIRVLRCVPMDRVLAVVRRAGDLLQNCDRCPDGECGFFDLLSCIDLQEAVSIVQEGIDIIRESRICLDGESEITLGEASSAG